MTGNARCIAIIPARGGSKRLPGKNIRILAGKPAIAHVITAVRKSQLFDTVVVSTDSEEIATIASEYGADVPYLRPPKLADDHTPISAATLDVLTRIDPDGSRYQHVAQLMASCPLITSTDVRDSYRHFVDSKAECQISISRYTWQNPWWAFERSPNLGLMPVMNGLIHQRSQDLPTLYCPTGAIWWAETSLLRRERTFHVEGRIGWEIPWQHAVDIDRQEDWELAELLAERQFRSSKACGAA